MQTFNVSRVVLECDTLEKKNGKSDSWSASFQFLLVPKTFSATVAATLTTYLFLLRIAAVLIVVGQNKDFIRVFCKTFDGKRIPKLLMVHEFILMEWEK